MEKHLKLFRRFWIKNKLYVFFRRFSYRVHVIVILAKVKMVEARREQSLPGFCIGVDCMPMKPKHPCSYPGCPKLTGRRYCEEHEKLMNQRYEKYERDSSVKKRYGKTWEKIRKRYVQMHPVCEMCFERGIIVETEEVHHKIPLSEGGTHEESNLIGLCKSCHSSIHASGGRFESRPHAYHEEG